MPSICVVAGDPSGDLHAARLLEALKATVPSLAINGLGGPAMRRAGCSLLDELTTCAAIGPFDAARHLPRFLRARRLLERHLSRARPDLALLVDFGDFNLPVIAPLVKRHRIPIAYYISPQIWAWGRWRLRYIRRFVDRMLVLFQFEEAFYRREGIPVTWVGHPLVDVARPSITKEQAAERAGLNPWRRMVGLLPGSREREVLRHLPLLLSAAERIAWRMPGVQFVLPQAPGVSRDLLQRAAARAAIDIRVVSGPLCDTLQLLEAAVIASGTATLEAALCELPMVVVYRASWPTYIGARLALRIPHIAIVNILAARQIVPELIQHQANPPQIATALTDLLQSGERSRAMKEALRDVRARLGPPGAVERAAAAVRDMLISQQEIPRRAQAG